MHASSYGKFQLSLYLVNLPATKHRKTLYEPKKPSNRFGLRQRSPIRSNRMYGYDQMKL